MVDKAKENARLLRLRNVEVHVADILAVPLEDACADVVISNGAINLSPHKPCVFKEVFRILAVGSSSPTWCGIAPPRPRAAAPGPTASPGRSNPSGISKCSARRALGTRSLSRGRVTEPLQRRLKRPRPHPGIHQLFASRLPPTAMLTGADCDRRRSASCRGRAPSGWSS